MQKSQSQQDPPRTRVGGPISTRWKRIQGALAGSLQQLAHNTYRTALGRVLDWRYATLAAGVAGVMLTAGLVGSGVLRFSFFPPIEADYVTARLALPPGTPIEVTARAIEQIERAALRMKEELDAEFLVDGESLIKHILSSAGSQPSTASNPSQAATIASASNLGEVSLELIGSDARPVDAQFVLQRWREATPQIPDVQELVYSSALFSVGLPIFVQLRSADVAQLERAADELKAHLATYPGVFDVVDSFEGGKEEIQLDILPAAETLGVTLDDLASQVRQAFYGAEAQRIQRGRDDIRVMVRYPAEERRSLADLDNLRIRTPSGGEVPFYAVARAKKGIGYSTIKRADRERVIDVTADLDLTRANANVILADLEKAFLPRLLADQPGLRYSFEGAQREQTKTLAGLVRNFMLALIVIYALLAVPLRSYAQPWSAERPTWE